MDNIDMIESTLLQFINWDAVSTQVLLNISKNDKNRILSQSLSFKHKCKY